MSIHNRSHGNWFNAQWNPGARKGTELFGSASKQHCGSGWTTWFPDSVLSISITAQSTDMTVYCCNWPRLPIFFYCQEFILLTDLDIDIKLQSSILVNWFQFLDDWLDFVVSGGMSVSCRLKLPDNAEVMAGFRVGREPYSTMLKSIELSDIYINLLDRNDIFQRKPRARHLSASYYSCAVYTILFINKSIYVQNKLLSSLQFRNIHTNIHIEKHFVSDSIKHTGFQSSKNLRLHRMIQNGAPWQRARS